jgi:hypothetical protein
MTVAELRELLEVLPDKWDDAEVCVSAGPNGLNHIDELGLDARSASVAAFPHLRPERLQRKLKLRGAVNWQQVPPDWRLTGPWPNAAGDIGIEREMVIG